METELLIRGNYKKLLTMWEKQKTDRLKELVSDDVYCFFSTSGAGEEGPQHSLFGLRDFIENIPETECLKLEQGDFTCRLCKDCLRAMQYSTLVYHAKRQNDVLVCDVLMFLIWEKMDEKWKLVQIRMDIVNPRGELKEEYRKYWLFRDWKDRVSCPEIDSIWNWEAIDTDNSEEDKIRDVYLQAMMSLDYFDYETLSELIYLKEAMPCQFVGKMYELYRMNLAPFYIGRWEDVIVNGEEATAHFFDLKQKQKIQIRFIKRCGMWKISNYEEILGIVETDIKKIKMAEPSSAYENEVETAIHQMAYHVENLLFSSLSKEIADTYGINAVRYGRKEGLRSLLTKLKRQEIEHYGEKRPFIIKDIKEEENGHVFCMIYPLYKPEDMFPMKERFGDRRIGYGRYEAEFWKKGNRWQLLYAYGDEGIYELDE